MAKLTEQELDKKILKNIETFNSKRKHYTSISVDLKNFYLLSGQSVIYIMNSKEEMLGYTTGLLHREFL